MPSGVGRCFVTGRALACSNPQRCLFEWFSFYALGVGRCFVTSTASVRQFALSFLCPRCRAVLCDQYVFLEQVYILRFLCPRCRVVLCDGGAIWTASKAIVSM